MKRILSALGFLLLAGLPAHAAVTAIVTSPGGSNESVQVNRRGAFYGDSYLTYSTGTKVLSAPGLVISTLTANGLAYTFPSSQASGSFLATNGSGVLTWTPISASASDLLPGDTDYIQNRSTLQSGSVFYASSGTVGGPFRVQGLFNIGDDSTGFSEHSRLSFDPSANEPALNIHANRNTASGNDINFLNSSGVAYASISANPAGGGVAFSKSGGVVVTYGVTAGSATISNLTSGQCVQAGTGGLLTVTGAACGTATAAQVTALGVSTGSLQTQVLAVGLTTATLRAYFPVSLSTSVVGNLPVTNLGSGTNATSSTFWRGDGLWISSSTFAGAGGTPGTPVNSVQFNSAGAFGGSSLFNWSGSSLSVLGSGGAGVTYGVTAGSITASSSTFTGAVSMTNSKITGLSNGTAASDAAAFGQIFSGFQAPVLFTTTNATATTSSTYQVTALTKDITPTSSAHRIRITVSGTLRTAAGASSIAYATLKRGSTTLSTASGFAVVADALATAMEVPVSFTFIDSPATTSATTYAVYIRNDDNSTSVNWNANGVTSIMILEEII